MTQEPRTPGILSSPLCKPQILNLITCPDKFLRHISPAQT